MGSQFPAFCRNVMPSSDLVDKGFVVLCSKGKAIPVQASYRPIGFQEVEALPDFETVGT